MKSAHPSDPPGVTHIVALSGGKDSTAMALRLAEAEPRDYIYVLTPTGDELPPMASHWARLASLLGKALTIITPGYTLTDLIRKERMLPNWRARFCTKMLKVIPYQSFLMRRLPVISYVGLRADEQGRAGIEYDAELLITTRYPLREWHCDLNDVLAYLKTRHVSVPQRTDCARCPLQTLSEWWNLWHFYPAIFQSAVDDETLLGHTFRSPQRDTWPTSLEGLRAVFIQGRRPKPRQRTGGCRICSL